MISINDIEKYLSRFSDFNKNSKQLGGKKIKSKKRKSKKRKSKKRKSKKRKSKRRKSKKNSKKLPNPITTDYNSNKVISEGLFDIKILENPNTNNYLDEKKLLVKLFYADWCGHCVNFKPQWDEFKSSPPEGCVVSDFEHNSENFEKESELYGGISGFPTIIIQKVGDTSYTKYDGERTKEALESHINDMLKLM